MPSSHPHGSKHPRKHISQSSRRRDVTDVSDTYPERPIRRALRQSFEDLCQSMHDCISCQKLQQRIYNARSTCSRPMTSALTNGQPTNMTVELRGKDDLVRVTLLFNGNRCRKHFDAAVVKYALRSRYKRFLSVEVLHIPPTFTSNIGPY